MLDYLMVLTFILFVVILVNGMSKQIRENRQKREELEKKVNKIEEEQNIDLNNLDGKRENGYRHSSVEIIEVNSLVKNIQEELNLGFEELYSLLLILKYDITKKELRLILGIEEGLRPASFKSSEEIQDYSKSLDKNEESISFTVMEIQKIATLPFEDLYKSLLLLGFEISEKQLLFIIKKQKIELSRTKNLDTEETKEFLKINVNKLPFLKGETKYLYTAVDIHNRVVFSDIQDNKNENLFSRFMNNALDLCPFNVKNIQTNLNDSFVSKFTNINNINLLLGMHSFKNTLMIKSRNIPVSDFNIELNKKIDHLDVDKQNDILNDENMIKKLELVFHEDRIKFDQTIEFLVLKVTSNFSLDVIALKEMFLKNHQELFSKLKKELNIDTLNFESLSDDKYEQIKNNVKNNKNTFVKRPFILVNDNLYINEDKLDKFISQSNELKVNNNSLLSVIMPFISIFLSSTIQQSISHSKKLNHSINEVEIVKLEEQNESIFEARNEDSKHS